MSRIRKIAFLLTAALLLAVGVSQWPALAQSIGAQLSANRLGDVETGHYQAGDRIDFVLAEDGGRYLLKYANKPEIFVLSADRGPGGGRILKYDSGAMAAQIAGFGAITVYPDDAPNGLPAVRMGDAPKPVLETISLVQLQNEAQETGQNLKVAVAAEWLLFAVDPLVRSIGLEAMQNAEQGITRYIAQNGRAAFAQRVEIIRLQPSMRPSLLLAGKTLMVGFNQDLRFSGRMSSRAVAQTLNGMLAGK